MIYAGQSPARIGCDPLPPPSTHCGGSAVQEQRDDALDMVFSCPQGAWALGFLMWCKTRLAASSVLPEATLHEQ